MRLLLNIIWFVLAGVWMAIGYAFAALICFILIITIPFGIAALRIAVFALWPFGKTVIKRQDAGIASGIGNVIWFVLCGWWLALAHLITGTAAVPDDHRDPARARELQADPGVAAAARTRDRVRRSAACRRRRRLCDDPRPAVTGQASAARALAMSSVAITSLPNVVYSNSMLTFAAAS